MKLGLSTWSFLGMDVYSAVEAVGGAGIDYLELWGEHPHAYPGWVDERRLRDTLSAFDLTVSVHAPFTDLNPASPDPRVRGAIQDVLERFVEFSVGLGASMVTVHPGSVHNELLVGGSSKSSVETIRKMARAAGGRLSINVENQTRSGSKYHYPLASTPDSLLALLSEVDGAKCTLDVGHAHASGQDFLDLAGRLGRRMAEVHLSDNFGENDDHLVPGEGNAPLTEFFRRVAETDALVCLELNPHRYGRDGVLQGFRTAKRMFP